MTVVQHFMPYNSLCTRFKKTGVLSFNYFSLFEMSTGVGGKEHGWSYKVWDSQLGSHGVRVWCTDINSSTSRSVMWFRGCENAFVLTDGEARWNDFAGGSSCVSCVLTKVHISTCTSVQRHRVWMTTQSYSFISVFLRPYHSNVPAHV